METVQRLTIQRLANSDDANYLLSDAHTGEGVAQVNWLNVDGAPMALGDEGAMLEFGGQHLAEVRLANEREDAEAPDRIAGGAKITLVEP